MPEKAWACMLTGWLCGAIWFGPKGGLFLGTAGAIVGALVWGFRAHR